MYVAKLEVRVLWSSPELGNTATVLTKEIVKLLRDMGFRVEVSDVYKNRKNRGARVYIRCYVK